MLNCFASAVLQAQMQVPLYKHQDTGPVEMVVGIGGALEHGRC